MKIGIMQPYFLPYIGYWQLLNLVDKFVVYDNIEFTQKSWIRRNRILLNSKDHLISIPLKSDSDYLGICDRFLSDQYHEKDAMKLIRKIEEAYKKAPYYTDVIPIIEECMLCEEKNLFRFIFHSIRVIAEYLGITTELIISSNIEIDHNLKSQDRVLEICYKLFATSYVNPIGGLELYDNNSFKAKGIKLEFLKSNVETYRQFDNEFVPNLSIIDVMMFNSKDKIEKMLDMYELM